MVLLVCGINYKKAKLAIFEQCTVSDASLAAMLSALYQENSISEAMILSTCNRTEIIVVADQSFLALDWMARYFSIELDNFPGYLYQDQAAAIHLMEVACGLDSMVLGETQILGQLKKAFEFACEQKTIGLQLQQLLPFVFHVGKSIHTQTDIGRHAKTLPAVIRKLIQECSHLPSTPQILWIGAGQMNTDVAKALRAYDLMPTYWINRTFEKAQQRALEIGGIARSWDALEQTIPTVDIIISATSSNKPILTDTHFGQNQKLLCIDLAIPRDIHEDVKQLPHVDLYYLDDLHSRLESGEQFRQHAALDAKKLILNYADEFATIQTQQDHSALIFQYRAQAEQLRIQALEQALNQLNKGIPAEEVCAQLSKQLTSRLLHHPTIGLRDMIARSDKTTLACLAARLEREA
jgi:glutamyl-tRNA reductase